MSFGGGAVYDGRYIWYTSNFNGAARLYAYDPESDTIAQAGLAEGVPSDPITNGWMAAISPGKVCVAAAVNDDHARSWVGLAQIDPAHNVTCRVILECRHAADPRTEGSLDTAFAPEAMYCLPGPPGAGDKAIPHIYINRGTGKAILVDINAGKCTLTQAKSFNLRLLLPSNGRGAVANGKYYINLDIWDSASDTVRKIAKPKGYDQSPAHWLTINGDSLVLLGVSTLHIGKLGGPLVSYSVKYTDPKDSMRRPGYYFVNSSLFGPVSDHFHQLKMVHQGILSVPAAPDVAVWFEKHLAVSPDAASYSILARTFEEHGDFEKWLSAMDGYFKYADHDLQRAESEVAVANRLMIRGDYARASKYADDAAECGSHWAIQSAAYAAEGLGDWQRAERFTRQGADAYNNQTEWFRWCVRTGHGDLAAAQAQAVRATQGYETTHDTKTLNAAAEYFMLTGDNVRAMPRFVGCI